MSVEPVKTKAGVRCNGYWCEGKPDRPARDRGDGMNEATRRTITSLERFGRAVTEAYAVRQPPALSFGHPTPHGLVWSGDDRPELRCAGRDGGLDCHLIINHAGACHG